MKKKMEYHIYKKGKRETKSIYFFKSLLRNNAKNVLYKSVTYIRSQAVSVTNNNILTIILI